MTSQNSSDLPRRTRGVILLGMTIVAVLLDQASKLYAIRHWRDAPTMSFWGDIFRIEYAENHGAFLSLFSNLPDEVRFWILTVINGAVLVGLATYLLAAKSVTRMTFLPLMLVVVGGIGNLIDRVRFGYVVDFLNLGWGSLRTGIFNVADMAITAGFILMIIPIFFGEEQVKEKAKSSSNEPDIASQPTEQNPTEQNPTEQNPTEQNPVGQNPVAKSVGIPDASSHGNA